MLPVSVEIEHDGKITLHLRNAETASEINDEVILDVDHAGHWIRGIEVLGSVDFDLAGAVKPFEPKTPSEANRTGVCYDTGANAAFFYMQMTFPAGVAPRYAHSITPDARFGLDREGGFVWVSFSAQEATQNPEDFLAFLEVPIKRETRSPKHPA
jgi:tetrahydromethanopterin S-methyltransferase subunit B